MKIQIDIPDDKLYFLNVPEEYKNFTIMNYGYVGMWLMETDSKELNHWKVNIPVKYPMQKYKVLGFVKDVIVGEIKTDKNFVLQII